MRLAQRLLLGSLALISVLIVVVVVIVDQRLRARAVEESVRELAREARLVAAQWRPGMDVDSLADAAGVALGHRVTLIDSLGDVLGDSEFDVPALGRLENHSRRPEVVAARERSVGWARRVSPSEGDEQLYVAVRSGHGIARVSFPTTSLNDVFDRANRDVLFAGAVAMLVAAVLAALFARAISGPIVELRDVAQTIAAGDLSRRPAMSAPGEVGDLAHAIYRMSEQLSARVGALEAEEALLTALTESLNEGTVAVDTRRQVVRINGIGRELLDTRSPVPFSVDELPRDRTLRDALGAALGGSSVGPAETHVHGRTLSLTARPLANGGAVLALFDLTPLRRLEMVRRDFVANVSHELKTPLTVVAGFAETLTDDDVPAERRRQFAAMIRSNTKRMQRIVDDLLDLSRIESGGWVPNPVPTDVATAAAEAVAAAQEAAGASGVTLTVLVDPAAPVAYADPTALRQILGNLVENAVRHAAGGTVTIFTRLEPAGMSVGVRDTGTGIPAEHLPRIFERFYRVDAARSREAGGTGLGLAIVRHLVEAHGGSVRAESSVGRGTTVLVFFPAPRS